MEDKKYNLFLDDVRVPKQCEKYTKNKIYNDVEWVIVRNYNAFVKEITKNGLPELVSFDHDLAEAHYHESMYDGRTVYMKYLETVSEKTGMDCAKWMIDFIIDKKLSVPSYLVHSMNPVGKENIINFIENFIKHSNQNGDTEK